jgi:hypothetical protein
MKIYEAFLIILKFWKIKMENVFKRIKKVINRFWYVNFINKCSSEYNFDEYNLILFCFSLFILNVLTYDV